MKLVNGSGPHEGNILVGGLPVCDYYHGYKWHGRRNVLVVCRSYNNIRGGCHRKNQFGRTSILSYYHYYHGYDRNGYGRRNALVVCRSYKGTCQKRFSGFCPLRGVPPPPLPP